MRRTAVLICAIVGLLLLGGCRDDEAPRARIESLLAVDSIAGTQAALSVFGADTLAVMPGVRLDPVDSDVTALETVRAGRAVAAVTRQLDGRAPDGLALTEIETEAIGVFVPFTFALEGLTLAQARDIAGGRVRSWRELGGPALAIDVAAVDPQGVGQSLTTPFIGTTVADVTPALAGRPGRVVFAAISAAGPAAKALRIDGIRAGDDGYPLTQRWTLAGRTGDERVPILARSIAARVVERHGSEVVLDAVGDIMLARGVGQAIAERGARYPFEAVAPLLEGSDIRLANLEIAITERGRRATKDYTFRAPASSLQGLSWAGFNVVTLANNHSLDYGVDGLLDTLDALDRAGIARPGAGRSEDEAHRPVVLSVRGLRVAILSYVNVPNDGRSGWQADSMTAGPTTPGVAWGTPEAVRRDVADARTQADVVIVALHSGWEYSTAPNPVQRELAYASVDAGAALVLGAHPHVLQGIEFYKQVPIVYSLGNFVFDVDDDDRRQPGLPSLLSAVLRVRIGRDGVRALEVRPLLIEQRDGRPIPVSDAATRPIYDRLYSLTDALAGR